MLKLIQHNICMLFVGFVLGFPSSHRSLLPSLPPSLASIVPVAMLSFLPRLLLFSPILVSRCPTIFIHSFIFIWLPLASIPFSAPLAQYFHMSVIIYGAPIFFSFVAWCFCPAENVLMVLTSGNWSSGHFIVAPKTIGGEDAADDGFWCIFF